ncbi:hypothetical protein OAF35_00590 [Verrucomicrobiales bacterium]|nr:hypothetical protein [Verrucomicrobiales bacterium]
MNRLYFARFLFGWWTALGFVGYFICWGIEVREGIDMSFFRSVEATLILISISLVWVILSTVTRKYHQDNYEVDTEKTPKQKLSDMILLYSMFLMFIVPISCYVLGIWGWEFALVEFTCFIMLSIMGNIYNRLGLGSGSGSGSGSKGEEDEEFY